MKKYFSLIIALVAIIAVSCDRIDEIFSSPIVEREFNAILDGNTRTSIDADGNVAWEAGDMIKYYTAKNGEVKSATVPTSGNSATIRVQMEENASFFIAEYGGTGITDNTSGNSFTINGAVNATQTGLFKDAHVAVAKTYLDDGTEYRSLNFKNITSIIKFTLERTDVSKIVFTASNGEKIHGNGTVKINFSGTDATPSFGDDGGSSITVNTNGAGTYYIATLPVNLENGFSIACYTSTDELIGIAYGSKPINIKKNDIVNLGTLDSRLISSIWNTYEDTSGEKGIIFWLSEDNKIALVIGLVERSWWYQKYNWYDAIEWCHSYGDGGWDMPTIEELDLVAKNLSDINACLQSLGQSELSTRHNGHWSKTETSSDYVLVENIYTRLRSSTYKKNQYYHTVAIRRLGTSEDLALVTGISLDKSSVTMEVGEELSLLASVTPDNAINGSLTWISSNSDAVTVDENGKITAVADGSATITVSAADYNATCFVKAVLPSANIVFEDTLVKRICVDNWDTNGNGELSYSEASAIRDFERAFWNQGITTFDEFRFFTGIENFAFNGCDALTSIILPDHITAIPDVPGLSVGAFRACKLLSSITIPDSVTYIGENTFWDCFNLSSINIPNGVTSIGGWAFYNCSSLTSISLPSSLTDIGYNAFSGSGLTSISLPQGITVIKNGVFAYCTNLVSASIPQGITIIDHHAFRECPNLSSIIYTPGDNSPQVNDSGRIGTYAFYNCTSLVSLSLPECITQIGESAFEGCSSLVSIDIPQGVTSISQNAFRNCSSLLSLSIPDGVTSLSNGFFSGCSSLVSVHLPEGLTSIDDNLFRDCSSLTSVSLPEGITSIGWCSFNGCTNLTSITIPVGVVTIDEYAFMNCSSLSSISIPEGVTTIKYRTFYECSSLSSINLPSSITTIENEAFYHSGLTSITIPEGITTISPHTFSGCSGLVSVVIPETVTSIEEAAFSGCHSLTTISIPDSITSIGNSAFSACWSLTSISIPIGVTKIAESTFGACINLTSITLHEGITEIADRAFHSCERLNSIEVRAINPPSLGSNAFDYTGDCPIYVPTGSYSSYKAASGWKEYGNRIQRKDFN